MPGPLPTCAASAATPCHARATVTSAAWHPPPNDTPAPCTPAQVARKRRVHAGAQSPALPARVRPPGAGGAAGAGALGAELRAEGRGRSGPEAEARPFAFRCPGLGTPRRSPPLWPSPAAAGLMMAPRRWAEHKRGAGARAAAGLHRLPRAAAPALVPAGAGPRAHKRTNTLSHDLLRRQPLPLPPDTPFLAPAADRVLVNEPCVETETRCVFTCACAVYQVCISSIAMAGLRVVLRAVS